MRAHAAAQLIGGRSYQCDATATATHGDHRAYVLLDGIGSNDEVRDWTRATARRLARSAARRASAEDGLRAVHALAAAERQRNPYSPAAVAVVAVTSPGHLVELAWCGDSRAYLLTPRGRLHLLTKDHNWRQQLLDMGAEPGPGARNTVTSYLSYVRDNPTIGTCTVLARGRLILASDGAYEPVEDAGKALTGYVTGSAREAARALTAAAVELAGPRADNATALIIDL